MSTIRYKMLAIFKTVFEILFGGYATPTKCVCNRAGQRLNSYLHYKVTNGDQEQISMFDNVRQFDVTNRQK